MMSSGTMIVEFSSYSSFEWFGVSLFDRYEPLSESEPLSDCLLLSSSSEDFESSSFSLI